jgi:hypothetical protein
MKAPVAPRGAAIEKPPGAPLPTAQQLGLSEAQHQLSNRGAHKPQPRGEPGFLRIDTVHQGDQQRRKGLYHINAVDEVTQWEIVAATPQISELWLMPVLESMLDKSLS